MFRKSTLIGFMKRTLQKVTCYTKGWWIWEYENPIAIDLSNKSQSPLIFAQYWAPGKCWQKQLSTKLTIRTRRYLCNIEEKGWILVCLNSIYDLHQITCLPMNSWNTSWNKNLELWVYLEFDPKSWRGQGKLDREGRQSNTECLSGLLPLWASEVQAF